MFRRGWLWTGLLAFATIAFPPQPAHAAVIKAWVQRYSNVISNAADQALKVVRDAAGDIIVTGTTSGVTSTDMVTIKYSGADGSVLWQKRSSPGNPTGLAVDSSGNVVTGYSVGTNNNYDYYTAKYAAADGALLWEKRYNGLGNGQDWENAVAVDGRRPRIPAVNSVCPPGLPILDSRFRC